MTGPEHYREAERLIALTQSRPVYNERELAAAQVHATLALAAATALQQDGETRDLAWMDAAL